MTAQIRDVLIYKDHEYLLASEPLYPYLKGSGIVLVKMSTACHRGYVAKWLIEEDRLYLVEFEANIPKSNTEDRRLLKEDIRTVGLDYLFPNQDKVHAGWFSGVLCVPHGEMIRYVHQGYASIYEKELYLRFVNGKLVSWREVDNSSLKGNSKALREKEMDGIWESIFRVKRSRTDEKRGFFSKLTDIFR